MKLRIDAGGKSATRTKDKAIADAYGNKFIIPLDYEMLDSSAHYRLSYKITFKNYD